MINAPARKPLQIGRTHEIDHLIGNDAITEELKYGLLNIIIVYIGTTNQQYIAFYFFSFTGFDKLHN